MNKTERISGLGKLQQTNMKISEIRFCNLQCYNTTDKTLFMKSGPCIIT